MKRSLALAKIRYWLGIMSIVIKILTFLLFFQITLEGQNLPSLKYKYTLKNFDEKDGLLDREVNGLIFDCRGLGWLGNGDGLNIFDGQHVYKANKYLQVNHSILDEPVKALIYDEKQNKLIVFSYFRGSTKLYVVHLDRLGNTKREPIITYILSIYGPIIGWPIYEPNKQITCIIKFNIVNIKFEEFNFAKICDSGISAIALYRDKKNRVLFSRHSKRIYEIINNKNKTRFKYIREYISAEHEAMWMGQMFSDIRWEPQSALMVKRHLLKLVNTFTPYEYIKKRITGVAVDPLGNYYVCGHEFGLQKLSVINPFASAARLPMETRGIYYLPKIDKGLVASPLGIHSFSYKKLKLNDKPILRPSFYYTVVIPIADSLQIFLPQNPQVDSLNNCAQIFNSHTLQLSKKKLIYPKSITSSNPFQQLNILSSVKMPNGTIYLGTNFGLCLLTNDSNFLRLKPTGLASKETIKGIIILDLTNLLLATEKGILKVDLIRKKIKQIQEGEFNCLLKYPNGWIAGSRQAGAFFFNNQNQLVKQLSTNNGLNSNVVFSIMYDKKYKTVWLGTGNGLSMYQLNTNIIKTFSKKDGLAHSEFNRESTFFLPKDTMMIMGGITGISFIHNRALFYKNTKNIQPLIWSVDQTLENDKKISTFIQTNQIFIPFSHKLRKLVFHLVNYASDQQLYGLSFKIDNRPWQSLNNTYQIELLDVDAGKHTLEVKGTTVDGKNTPITIISYQVSQIWYKSWWGISLFTLLGALLMIPVFLIRNRIVQVKAKEELYKNREKLFGMIAHDLRSPLSAYQGLAGVINYLINKQEWAQLQKIGQEIDDTGRHLDLMLNNLLNWSLVQQKSLKPIYTPTSIDAIVNEILPVYKTVAGSKDITLDKKIEREKIINTDANLCALIIRNLLDNAVKNAPEKSTIKIDISQKGKSLTVLIENDFHEHKLPIVSDIVANINNPEWELKRGVGLKFVIQTLKLLKASIQVSILKNKNRIRWYVEIPEP